MMTDRVIRNIEKEEMLQWCVDTIADAKKVKMTTSNLYMELIEDAPLNLTPDVWSPNAIGYLLTRQGASLVTKIKGNAANGGADFYVLKKDENNFLQTEDEGFNDKNGIQEIVERAMIYLKKEQKAYLSDMVKAIHLLEITPQTLKRKLLARDDVKYIKIKGSSRAYFEYIPLDK